jgi:histidine triad (HIT) family protein
MTIPDCIFCKIVAGEIPATIVHRDEQATAFRDNNPAAPVHILIVPNRHIASMNALKDEDGGLIGSLFSLAASLARKEKVDGGGYRLVINTGSGAGQSVQHLHIHLMGGRQMQWPPG